MSTFEDSPDQADPLAQAEPPSLDTCVRLLAELPSLPLEERAGVVEQLVRSSSPEIRDRALHIGAAVLSDRRLTELLREEEDAALRNAGSEIFLLRGSRSLPAVVPLLGDPDPDVLLQAVLILDRLRDPRALEALHGVLAHSDVNVVQEAILAIGRLGDGRSVQRLLPFLQGEMWVQMAALQALGDLRSPEGVPPLAGLLGDPLLGSLAAESLARIGGEAAFNALAHHWQEGEATVEDEIMAGLLAYVLEGLPAPPRQEPEGLREHLKYLLRSAGETQSAAARCLLCLGPGPWDEEALAVLAASQPPSDFAPEPLRHRPDLMPRLLRGGAAERSWGFLLAARFPDQVPAPELLAAVRDAAAKPGWMSAEILAALGHVHVPGIAQIVLDLYLRLPAESRAPLEPVLAAHAETLRATLSQWPQRAELDEVSRLELAALLGEPAETLAEGILALDPPVRRQAVSRLTHHEALMRRLPWAEWLREEPDLFTGLAAEAASRYDLGELRDALRVRLLTAPSAALVRALGELKDSASTLLLIRLLDERQNLRPVVLEALGRLGGSAARGALRTAALAGGPDARIAYKALASCHRPGDLPLFREAASHPDWFVRLAAVQVLGLSFDPDDAALLARLVADPVPGVAQKALSLLEVGQEERR